MKNSVLIRKDGKFYHVFNDDAYIFNYLFNYNIVNYRVGFPISAYSKVINKLEENTINYVALGDEKIEKNFKNKNKYKRVLELSMDKDRVFNKLKEINSKLEKLSYEELIRVVSILEEEVL